MSDFAISDNSAALLQAQQGKLSATTTSLKNIAVPGSTLDPKTLRKIDEAAQDFEAVFLSEMIKPMFEGIEVDENFGGGRGEEVFSDLLVQEYGKSMSQAGGIGIASFVREELIRQQEGSIK